MVPSREELPPLQCSLLSNVTVQQAGLGNTDYDSSL